MSQNPSNRNPANPLQVPVWAVLDYTKTPTIERELLLAKVSILGPEFAHSQLSDSPTHADSTTLDHEISNQDFTSPPAFISGNNNTAPAAGDEKIQREQALARTFESSGSGSGGLYPGRGNYGGMSASEALIAKNLHMNAIKMLVDQFGGRVVDVAENSVIVEVTAKGSRVDAFLALMRPFGVLEAARSGTSNIAIRKSSLSSVRCHGLTKNTNPKIRRGRRNHDRIWTGGPESVTSWIGLCIMQYLFVQIHVVQPTGTHLVYSPKCLDDSL
jgi:acetolactate synthase small subunit